MALSLLVKCQVCVIFAIPFQPYLLVIKFQFRQSLKDRPPVLHYIAEHWTNPEKPIRACMTQSLRERSRENRLHNRRLLLRRSQTQLNVVERNDPAPPLTPLHQRRNEICFEYHFSSGSLLLFFCKALALWNSSGGGGGGQLHEFSKCIERGGPKTTMKLLKIQY